MSRRVRAAAFALAALVCAGLAARSVSGYGANVQAQLGPLRPAVVAPATLPAGRVIGPAAARKLVVRRVPSRFLPPGVIAAPAQAIGRAPGAAIPAGAYLLDAQLRDPGPHAGRRSRPRLGRGREPVEIAVTGAAALASGAGGPLRRAVDVIVTSEPHGASGEGRTYLAAKDVRLLDLRPADPGATGGDALAPSLPDAFIATLALTRAQALKLIQAQNFAREVRLVAAR